MATVKCPCVDVRGPNVVKRPRSKSRL
uniref:Uncharacterized protein n=1 Tax=Anguilla anguilla TaxID=7936 RepID=A0A0E9P5Q4_ANGAN